MELGTALTFVGTRTGLSPTWARAGSGFAGDFLGEGRGVTISSTTHCGLPAGGLNRWIRTAMSLSGSMVPRCVDPNSFTSVTDMESFIVEKVVTEKRLFFPVRLLCLDVFTLFGRIFFSGSPQKHVGWRVKCRKKFCFPAETRVSFFYIFFTRNEEKSTNPSQSATY
jgi:hypothetical protein